MDELNWWFSEISNVWAPFSECEPDVVIHADASTQGWGAFSPATGQKCGSGLSEIEAEHHINALDLLAIFYDLTALCPEVTHKHIRVMTDNTTAMTRIY